MHRNSVTHRGWSWTLAALAASALALAGTAPALAQATKTCTHEGRSYPAGAKLTIDGQEMVCDGATGTWAPSKG